MLDIRELGPDEMPLLPWKLLKLGETVTETLEAVSRRLGVIQMIRERFTCRTCETITQRQRRFTRSHAGVPTRNRWP